MARWMDGQTETKFQFEKMKKFLRWKVVVFAPGQSSGKGKNWTGDGWTASEVITPTIRNKYETSAARLHFTTCCSSVDNDIYFIFLKSFIEFVIILLLFCGFWGLFWFFGREACGIFAP